MSAFETGTWQNVRADALETEADAIEAAIARLGQILGALDGVEQLTIGNAIAVLQRIRDHRKESAAKLRAAA